MNQEKIGKFILELRKEKNMTQQELADKIGVTDRAISKWENGRGMPDLSLMKPLCDVLGITLNELISGSLIIEKIFAVPGVGKLYLESITFKDYDFFMLLSGFYLSINLIAGLVIDLSYGIIDPRIRMGAR